MWANYAFGFDKKTAILHGELLIKDGWIASLNKNTTFELKDKYYKIYEDEIEIFLESSRKHSEVEQVCIIF